MNKKYLLVILAIVILLIYSKRSTAAPKTPPIADENNLGTASTFYTVKKGDTLYKIVSKFWNTDEGGQPTREKLLNFARQNSIANGFNWNKYDDVPTSDLQDPDTLKVGQKLVIWTWGSFNENAPTTGALMPGQQANAFNSFDILI